MENMQFESSGYSPSVSWLLCDYSHLISTAERKGKLPPKISIWFSQRYYFSVRRAIHTPGGYARDELK